MKLSKNSHLLASKPLSPKHLLRVYRILRKAFAHQHWWPGDSPFEVMVGAILTQNTAWINVEKAIQNLKRAGKMNPGSLHRISQKNLARLIKPAGYFNLKARRLKHFIAFLMDEYDGEIKKMTGERTELLRQKLLNVHGIGPETADSILVYALGKRSFVIDAYTKRIFGRHGLESPAKPYEQWRLLFEKSLPRNLALYNDYHAQIVHLGKYYCRTSPQCDACPLKPYL